MIDNTKREKSSLGRFEIIAEAYIYGTEKQREIILSFLDEKEKKTFLEGVGLFKMFIQPDFYNAVCNAVGERIYIENH